MKKAVLMKFPHISDRTPTSLRILWDLSEEEATEVLMDGGVLIGQCLGPTGEVLHCPGTLCIFYNKDDKEGGQERRQMRCQGVPQKYRHNLHWLGGVSVSGRHQGECRRHVAVLRGAENN